MATGYTNYVLNTSSLNNTNNWIEWKVNANTIQAVTTTGSTGTTLIPNNLSVTGLLTGSASSFQSVTGGTGSFQSVTGGTGSFQYVTGGTGSFQSVTGGTGSFQSITLFENLFLGSTQGYNRSIYSQPVSYTISTNGQSTGLSLTEAGVYLISAYSNYDFGSGNNTFWGGISRINWQNTANPGNTSIITGSANNLSSITIDAGTGIVKITLNALPFSVPMSISYIKLV